MQPLLGAPSLQAYSNAIKFTPEHGRILVKARWSLIESKDVIHFTLSGGELATCTQRGVLELSVSDTGAGLSQDEVSKLFREGVQFNVNRLQAGQGSGLGLYISKGIAEQHGGRLAVSSEGLEKGTSFTLTLPLYFVPEGMEPLQKARHRKVTTREDWCSSSATANRPAVKFAALRILVVDDADSNRKLLARLLTKKGHECGQAQNGQEAIEMAVEAMSSNQNYDVILLDYEVSGCHDRPCDVFGEIFEELSF